MSRFQINLALLPERSRRPHAHSFCCDMHTSNCCPSLCRLQLRYRHFTVHVTSRETRIQPIKMLPQNSASHLTLPRTQACFTRPLAFFCLGDGISLTASAYRGIRSNPNSADHCRCHHFTLHVTSHESTIQPIKMLPQTSASHLPLPRTQACFPRPLVFFCLDDGISLTASAYRGIRSKAHSADRNVTHNLAHCCYPFCSEHLKLKLSSFIWYFSAL